MSKDMKAIVNDRLKQRKVQYGTGTLAVGSVILWFLGIQPAAFVAALFIILCAVSTLHMIDDDDKLDKLQK